MKTDLERLGYKITDKLRKKRDYIQKTLNKLYPQPIPPLNYTNHFELLIAVLLSAQCTDKTVNRITPLLFERASHPKVMARLNLSTIKSIIKPCGLYIQKAEAIKELSRILINKHNGEVPADLDDLKQLPGVGHKTASVVLVQGFNIPAFPVDTHIHRLGTRWGISNGKNVKQTEIDFKKIFPYKNWGKLHLQIIYYGREYCPARYHLIEECPICLGLKKI